MTGSRIPPEAIIKGELLNSFELLYLQPGATLVAVTNVRDFFSAHLHMISANEILNFNQIFCVFSIPSAPELSPDSSFSLKPALPFTKQCRLDIHLILGLEHSSETPLT